MRRFSRVYIEIMNICNMSCSFCVGNTRVEQVMELEAFESIVRQIKPITDYIYLHVLGEPLMHPKLAEIMALAEQYELKVSITTNGTLLEKKKNILLTAPSLRKISISVHSMEGKDRAVNLRYLEQVATFAREATGQGILCELRIWNLGVDEISNEDTCMRLFEYLQIEEAQVEVMMQALEEKGSVTLMPKLFLGKAERFQWPSLQVPRTAKQDIYCHGLRSQLAILVDGTVVPCCLDSHGDIPLGNVLIESLEEILGSERAVAMYEGFSNRKPTEELCKRCGYATRF